MQGSPSPELLYAFLEFTLDPAAERIRRGVSEIKLRPKSFQVLRYLVERPGRVVTRDELIQEMWGDVAVSDESLTKCIADIRKALADDSQQIIRTVTRRGFLFQAEVRVSANGAADQIGPAARMSPRRAISRGLSLGAIGAFLVVTGVASFRWGPHLSGRGTDYEAIAVLPFESLSSGPDQQYLADWMTEALITNLGQASPLRVIARTSVNQYQKTRKPVRQIARELDVDVVVEGAITQFDGRLRVTAKLIQVSPEMHIWAKSYDRKSRDSLALQDEIAAEIAEEVRARVAPRQRAREKKKRPVNPEAQLARLKARYFVHSRRTPDGARKSLEYSERAVRLDPEYAEAHAALALSYVMLTYMGVAVPGGAGPPARAAANRAISLDPDLTEAHVAHGKVLFLYERDAAGAERAFRRALSLNPSDADARMNLAGCLAALDRMDEAVAEIKRARQLDPFSFLINREVGRILYYARRYDEALAELHKAGEMQPDSSAVAWWVVRCLLRKGMHEQAIAADLTMRRNRDKLDEGVIAELRAAQAKQSPRAYWSKLREVVLPIYSSGAGRAHMVDIDLRLGNRDEALKWLESSANLWSRVEPEYDPLRGDSRFEAILQRQRVP